MSIRSSRLLFVVALFFPAALHAQEPARWTAEDANAWYKKQPWLVGCNFIPSTAINQLEMWQADTLTPRRSTASWAGPPTWV